MVKLHVLLGFAALVATVNGQNETLATNVTQATNVTETTTVTVTPAPDAPASCVDPDSPFFENCCTAERQCSEYIGGCSADDQCSGDLTCGVANCEVEEDSNCCIRLCANSNHTEWEYDASCCTVGFPCPRNQGGCSENEECLGDLVCVEDACGPDYPAGSSCCIDSTLHEADRESIEAIYDALNGANWLQPWTIDGNLCDEPTITCQVSLQGRFVLRVTISDRNAEGDLVEAFDHIAEIGGFQNLQDLTIVDCENLSSRIPTSINTLRGLNTFDIINTGVYGEIPEDLFHTGVLNELRYLRFHNNKMYGPIPAGLSHNVKLINWEMPYNNFSGPIPDELASLQGLEYVDLSNNMLTGPVPTFFNKDSPRLRELWLSHNDFDCPVPRYRLWARAGDEYFPADPSRCNSGAAVVVDPSGPSTAVIAAVVAVAVGFVAACVILAFFWWSKRKLEEAARQRRAPNDPTLNVRFAEVDEMDEED